MCGLIVPALILRCSLCRRSVTASWKSLARMSSVICITHATLTPRALCSQDNHAPKHVGIVMKQRNFSTGEAWCTLCQRNLPLPKRGIDLYVGTYPCSPWSRRGTRAGWDHPSVDTFRIGVETIAYIQPAVWIIELGELPENEAIDEVIAAIREACSRAGSECTIQVVPVRRTRSFWGCAWIWVAHAMWLY